MIYISNANSVKKHQRLGLEPKAFFSKATKIKTDPRTRSNVQIINLSMSHANL